jgi:hypothetical protein
MQIRTCLKTHKTCKYPHIQLCKICPIIKNNLTEPEKKDIIKKT